MADGQEVSRKRITQLTETIEFAGTEYFVVDHPNNGTVKASTKLLNALRDNMAAHYDEDATYQKGDFCTYRNVLKKAKVDIPVAEEWNSGHWEDAVITEEMIAADKLNSLTGEVIPNTVQEYTFSDGSVSQVVHSRSGSAVRTDSFTYGDGTITETRTLATGESLTIETDLETLETVITYAVA